MLELSAHMFPSPSNMLHISKTRRCLCQMWHAGISCSQIFCFQICEFESNDASWCITCESVQKEVYDNEHVWQHLLNIGFELLSRLQSQSTATLRNHKANGTMISTVESKHTNWMRRKGSVQQSLKCNKGNTLSRHLFEKLLILRRLKSFGKLLNLLNFEFIELAKSLSAAIFSLPLLQLTGFLSGAVCVLKLRSQHVPQLEILDLMELFRNPNLRGQLKCLDV